MATILDNALLEEIQYHMLEDPDLGVTWASAMWTKAEVLGYLQQRQQRFLKEAPIMLGRAEIVDSAVISQPLPEDWMITYRLVWKDADGTWTELPRVDHREMDLAYATWPSITAAKPRVFADTDSATLTIDVVPVATNTGEYEITYVPIAYSLSGLGDPLQVPAEFVSTIKYGIMADMFGKKGRAHDAARAEYCEARFAEGVMAANFMVRGFV